MNQQIIDYLKQNKDKYSKEDLVEQLKKAGHEEKKINESIQKVYYPKEAKKKKFKELTIGFFMAVIGLPIIGYLGYKILDVMWYLVEATGKNKIVVMIFDLVFSISPFLVFSVICYFLWRLIKTGHKYIFFGTLIGIGFIIAFFGINFVIWILAFAIGG